MYPVKPFRIIILLPLLLTSAGVFYASGEESPFHSLDYLISNPDTLDRMIGEVLLDQHGGMEAYLLDEALRYDQRRKELWKPDFSSVENFLQSVEPNRERWREAMNPPVDYDAPLDPTLTPWFETDKVRAWLFSLPLKGNFYGNAILIKPKRVDQKLPVVFCQHGLGSNPADTIKPESYHSVAIRLAERGYAVFSTFNTSQKEARNYFRRLTNLLARSVWGVEIARTSRFIDYVESAPDLDGSRVALWGKSYGGFFTQFALPLEPRLKVGIITASFNKRVPKMVILDPRYSCFTQGYNYTMETVTPGRHIEEDIYIRGYIREFGDAELTALALPRPVMIQHGRADRIAHAPMVAEEFDKAKAYYSRLGLGGRIELVLHDGGHEMMVEEGIAFLDKWLK